VLSQTGPRISLFALARARTYFGYLSIVTAEGLASNYIRTRTGETNMRLLATKPALMLLTLLCSVVLCGCNSAKQAAPTVPVLTSVLIYSTNLAAAPWTPANTPASQTANSCSIGAVMQYMAVGTDQNGKPFPFLGTGTQPGQTFVPTPIEWMQEREYEEISCVNSSCSEINLSCVTDGVSLLKAEAVTSQDPDSGVGSPEVTINVTE
jgi:hypothetical protein